MPSEGPLTSHNSNMGSLTRRGHESSNDESEDEEMVFDKEDKPKGDSEKEPCGEDGSFNGKDGGLREEEKAGQEEDMSTDIQRQESALGNGINWAEEHRTVKDFCKFKILTMIKFPTVDMVNFSMYSSKMLEDKWFNQNGIICRFALERYGKDMADPVKWWDNVKGVCVEAIRKKRNSIVEMVKDKYVSKWRL